MDTKQSSELRPCPFCGSEARADDIIGRYVYCPNADCHLWRLEGEEIERDEWNTRPLEDALRAQHVAEMAAKVEALEWRDKEICTIRKQLEVMNNYHAVAVVELAKADNKLDIAVEALERLASGDYRQTTSKVYWQVAEEALAKIRKDG